MSTQRIKAFLDNHDAKYAIIYHSPAYTAQEVAASAHIPGKDLIKTVVVSIDGRLAIAAVPATHDVDLERLRKLTGAADVTLATEREFEAAFPGCKLGAVPPFGALFAMDTFVDRDLARERYIAFNGGSHSEVIAMEFNDYRRVAHPKLVHIGMPAVEGIQRTAQI